MDVRLLRSAYLSGLIMPDVYRVCEPFFVGLVYRLRRDPVDDEEGAVAANVVVDGRLLPWSPAYCDEFVELGILDHVPLVAVIGIADAPLECCKIDLDGLEVHIELI